MKKLMIIIVMGFNFFAFGQKAKKTEIEILLQKGIKPELAFFWETKDTLVLPNKNFRETIEFDLINKKCILQNVFSRKKIELTKDFKLNDRHEIDSQRDFEYDFDIVDNTFVTTGIDKYKIYFDEKKKNIVKIENIQSKHIFIPKKYENYRSPLAPMSSAPSE
ncbi:MAG: hypothetical protein EOO44_08720 [Flavobacterium sp.]|nr:MAG: hypothetical protein EOO44_08720 [Flavobacterium sp.]